MLHSEENALLAYNGSYQDIQGATAFITSRPCHKCLRMLIQKGITKIVYGTSLTKVVNNDDIEAQKIMLRHHPEIQMIEIDTSINVSNLLKKTIAYIGNK
jgi:deoxycytidylate deaminase